EVAPERFARHLAERLPASADGAALDAVMSQLSLSELYLACACSEGISTGLAAFEQAYLSRLPLQLSHLRQSDDVLDDVCQQVRGLLLLRTPHGGPPGISAYGGRGRLMSWVRVAAVRVARRRGVG